MLMVAHRIAHEFRLPDVERMLDEMSIPQFWHWCAFLAPSDVPSRVTDPDAMKGLLRQMAERAKAKR